MSHKWGMRQRPHANQNGHAHQTADLPREPVSETKGTFVSLYSGAGWLDLGFTQAGFTPVFANDIDPALPDGGCGRKRLKIPTRVRTAWEGKFPELAGTSVPDTLTMTTSHTNAQYLI